jgi:hypothetical protein
MPSPLYLDEPTSSARSVRSVSCQQPTSRGRHPVKTRLDCRLIRRTVPDGLDLRAMSKGPPSRDGLTCRDYEQHLERNLEDLHARVHRGAYRVPRLSGGGDGVRQRSSNWCRRRWSPEPACRRWRGRRGFIPASCMAGGGSWVSGRGSALRRCGSRRRLRLPVWPIAGRSRSSLPRARGCGSPARWMQAR